MGFITQVFTFVVFACIVSENAQALLEVAKPALLNREENSRDCLWFVPFTGIYRRFLQFLRGLFGLKGPEEGSCLELVPFGGVIDKIKQFFLKLFGFQKENCENTGTEECDELNKTCEDKDGNGYECNACKEGFVEVEGSDACELEKCENVGTGECDELNKMCENKEDDAGYECTDCKEGFVAAEGSKACEPETCENVGTGECDELNKMCENKEDDAGYECTSCKEGFVEVEGSEACEREKCDNVGSPECDELNRMCVDKDETGYECTGCKEGFVEVEGSCERETCANSGTERCNELNRECDDIESGGYQCGNCFDKYIRVQGNESCALGRCPAVDSLYCRPNRDCFDDCGGEKQCKDPRRICCKTNCGNMCPFPVYEGPFGIPTDEVSCIPMCPRVEDINCRQGRDCFDDCGGEKQCRDPNRICCKSNCGNQCPFPIFRGESGTRTNETSCPSDGN